jgi:hypothetical protein
VFPELADPLLHLLETFLRGYLIGNDGTQGLSIIDRSDRVVFLLTGSVLSHLMLTHIANLTCCLFSNTIFFSR